MEVALSAVSVRPIRITRNRPNSLRYKTMPVKSIPLPAKLSGFLVLACKGNRSRTSLVTAALNNTTETNTESAQENVSTSTDRRGPKNSDKWDDQKMIRVCDKLIPVFMVEKPTPTDWRRLLIFSKEWDNIRPHFYKRCKDRADAETDPGMKHQLHRLARKLKEIDEDVQRHNELFNAIRSPAADIGEIVAKRRKDFTKEFFVHLFTVAQSYYDDPAEKTAVTNLGNDCIAAVQAFDTTAESIEAINAAELKLKDIINSPSVEAACKKIDDLAANNQLDPTLVLMISKAWSAAKETDLTKSEAKDIMYHLYKTAVGNFQRLMPKPVRILKYLLTVEDPEELVSALKDAFTPGEELEGSDIDCLYTTPVELHTLISNVVDAYNFSREGTLIREARDLMNPKIIHKLVELKQVIQDEFM